MYILKYVTFLLHSVSMLCISIVFLGPFVAILVDTFEVITNDVHVSYRGTMATICNREENRFQILMSTQLSDCVIECALREHCLVMNYNINVKLCELYHLDKLTSNISGNCFRVEKKDINITKSPCKESPCSPGTVCDRNTKSCKTKECLVAPNITNGQVLGNLRSVGNRMRYVCNHGFKFTNISNNVAVCRENGSWSTEGICVANVKLNEECLNVTKEDACMDENTVCSPNGSVNTCQCIEGYMEDNGDMIRGNCIPKPIIGELCDTTNSTCAHSSVRCVKKKHNKYCHCQFGYEFEYNLGICVKVCSAYSNDSSEFKGESSVGINDYNLPSAYTVSWTMDNCVKFCNENAPIYLSIERHTFGMCICGALSEKQYSDVYGKLDENDNDWTFYNRPCAIIV